MKRVYREITPVTSKDVFRIFYYPEAEFRYPLHHHPEYEINLVLGSKGTRIVGDAVERYEEEELVLLGPYIQHCWDGAAYVEETGISPEVIVVQFHKDLFTNHWLMKDAFVPIRILLSESSRGIEFFGETRKKGIKMLKELRDLSGFPATLAFFEFLYVLATTTEKRQVASAGYVVPTPYFRNKRIEDVYNYINQHFKKDLQLAEVAAVANMSPSAFSHYFKKCSNKSFIHFLVEKRVSFACKLLLETECTVREICFESGFNNLSNFNRLFKKYKGVTPKAYRLSLERELLQIKHQGRFFAVENKNGN